MDSFRLQLRYGKRWGPIHPGNEPMSDDRLVANYSFAEGEYIASMTIYAGGVLDGFTMATNVQTYPHAFGTRGKLMPPASGQRLLFMSGELNEPFGFTMVTGVRVYFDTC